MSVAAACAMDSGQQKNPSTKLIEGFFVMRFCSTVSVAHQAIELCVSNQRTRRQNYSAFLPSPFLRASKALPKASSANTMAT